MIIVPVIISRTFQLITDGSIETGSMPAATKMTAADSAVYGLYLGAAIMRTYISIKSIKAASFIFSAPKCFYNGNIVSRSACKITENKGTEHLPKSLILC